MYKRKTIKIKFLNNYNKLEKIMIEFNKIKINQISLNK